MHVVPVRSAVSGLINFDTDRKPLANFLFENLKNVLLPATSFYENPGMRKPKDPKVALARIRWANLFRSVMFRSSR
jgi:hypothetical protein